LPIAEPNSCLRRMHNLGNFSRRNRRPGQRCDASTFFGQWPSMASDL